MKHLRLQISAALAAASLAAVPGFAQTISSPGVNPGGPTTSSPISGAPNPGWPRNEPNSPAPGVQNNAAASPPNSPAPSAAAGLTMSSGPDRALATPEDRATCAALSGTARADCMADTRKQRESRGRM
ncbi:MAG TPA: hypothetical protein VN747_02775 [Burkholderiales bacterium]|nr:hypothetical protein [Burkholderiales bacterium]